MTKTNKLRIILFTIVLCCLVGVFSQSAYAAAKPKLNKQKVSLYYCDKETKAACKPGKKYPASYQFKVKNYKGKVKWSVSGKMAGFCYIDGKGKLVANAGPDYGQKPWKLTVKAKLQNGKQLKATVSVYAYADLYLQKKVSEFQKRYVTAGMKQKDVIDKIGWYVSAFSSYDTKINDPAIFLAKQRGDCLASRQTVTYFARAFGMKAADGIEHGVTYVKADGYMYRVTTGFDEVPPRTYVVEAITEAEWNYAVMLNDLDSNYFGNVKFAAIDNE